VKSTQVLEVVVWDKRVGALAADPRLGCYVFAYDPAWKRTAVELAPLTMRSTTGEGSLHFQAYRKAPSTVCPQWWPTRCPTTLAMR